MPITDNSLISQYIRAIENPDSIGYRDGKWYKSGSQSHDANNRGFGIDVVENKDARALTQGRKGQWLLEDEERRLRLKHLDYINEALDNNTPWSILRNQPSEEAKAMALGMLYRGDSVMQNPKVREAYLSGSDEKMKKAVSDYYTNENPHKERAANHNKFFSTKRNVEARAEEDPYKYIRKQELWKPKSFAEYQYKPNAKFSEGGSLDNYWSHLSMKDKAEMMRVAIANGITTLPEIREVYNKFAKGGPKNYHNWASQLSNYWGEDISKHDYDYEKYYNDNPEAAYAQLKAILAGGHGHFPDGGESGTYKKLSHPTYPDLGDRSWSDNDTIFHISDRQMYDGDTDRILNYLGEDLNYNRGGTKVMHDDAYVLPSVNVFPNSWNNHPSLVPNKYHTGWVYEDSPSRDKNFAYGGNLFADGGSKSNRDINSERAMSYLMSRGMSNTGAAAIVGTLLAESGLDPTIHAKMKGDSGEGLAQWTGSRKNNFWSTLETLEPGAKKKYGSIDKVPFERQLDVVLAERPTVTAAIHNAKDVNAATDIMLRGYENGGGAVHNLASVKQMNDIYGKWNNGYDNQMKTRLGNANRLLGLEIDPSSYQISKGFFDDVNSQIGNANIASLHSDYDVDPEFRFKPIEIDETMFQQPKKETPLEDPLEGIYDEKEERLQGMKRFASMMGILGNDNPYLGLVGSGSAGLLGAINNIYN